MTVLKRVKSNGDLIISVELNELEYDRYKISTSGYFVNELNEISIPTNVAIRESSSGTISFTGNFVEIDPNKFGINLSNNSILENQDIGTFIGTLTTNLDFGSTFTYNFVSGSGSEDNSSFVISGDQLQSNAFYNFEAKNTYNIRIGAFNDEVKIVETPFTINIQNIIEAGTLTLSTSSAVENIPPSVAIAALDTQAEQGFPFTYSLVSGTGDTDNSSFSIAGTALSSLIPFNESIKNSYNIRIRSTSVTGQIVEQAFIIKILPTVAGSIAYTTPGVYNFIVPKNVYSVSVVCVGAGGDQPGSGGGLGWKNNIAVLPGQTIQIKVGAEEGGSVGGESYFNNSSFVRGGGGSNGNNVAGGSFTGDGGGNGGATGNGTTSPTIAVGGGGAGGYTGNGGRGGGSASGVPTSGSGGGGGGGGRSYGGVGDFASGNGGGVGIFGQGTDGAAGVNNGGVFNYGTEGGNGSTNIGNGVPYGEGGGHEDHELGQGGSGAVRIIWGKNRSFPSTNTVSP